MTCVGHLKYISATSIIFRVIHSIFATQLFYLKARFLLLLFLLPVLLFAQPQQPDSVGVQQKIDSSLLQKNTAAINKDSASVANDSTAKAPPKQSSSYQSIIERALQHSHYLKSNAVPVARVSRIMPPVFNDILFYIVLVLLLFFAFLRFLYERYFNNMFRVFFNTSLRQSQLTDQLLQAKQVSLLYNILFSLTGGLYVYFLFTHFKWIDKTTPLIMIGICTVSLAVVYFLKYVSLRFTGWITGYREAAGTYLFIIFLINKILGVLLIPFVIVIAFGRGFLQYPAVLVSLIIIGIMFLLRFFRSYGLLRKDIKVSRFHFFIYILGIEVLPLLLIYKSLVVLFGKNG